MSYDIQEKSGSEKNKLYIEDTAFHDWYRFVLSYPPHLVRYYLEKFEVRHGQRVLDPFCGTGTTLVESKKMGVSSIGIEANPVVQFAAKTKLVWNVDYEKLINHSRKVAQEAQTRIRTYSEELRSLTPAQEKLIIKNSISEVPLHKALILLDVIQDFKVSQELFDLQRLAFAKQLVFSCSNLHFGPEVGVSRRKKEDAPVVELWFNQVSKMADDLQSHTSFASTPAEVYLGDARDLEIILTDNSIHALITSPPYPNEKDYTRTTRLESVLLGFVVEQEDLRHNKKRLLRSNSRNIYKGDTDESYVESSDRVMSLARQIEERRIELGKTSGFEKMYHRVVKNYFGGMVRHLRELKPMLTSGAQLAYVVGDQASYFRIPIRTGEILADLARMEGYEVLGIDLFRTRLSTVTKEQLREEVVCLKIQ